MNRQEALDLLADERLVETLHIMVSAEDQAQFEAAAHVMRYKKPSSHARNLLLDFVRDVKSKYPSEFSLELERARERFIARKIKLAEKSEVTIIKRSKK